MAIQKVGVVGCGLMGHGIVQVAAQGGCQVVVLEAEQKFLDSGLARIDKSLAKLAMLMPVRYAKEEVSSGFLGSIDRYAYRSPGAPAVDLASASHDEVQRSSATATGEVDHETAH